MAAPGQLPELVVNGPIATITLRRPEVANRLEMEDLALLAELIEEVNHRREVLVLRLTAQGRYFCSGFNIASFDATGNDPGALFAALGDTIERARPVTIAALPGPVYGGGSDLALACDFRIATKNCELMVPAAKLGTLFFQSGMERMVARLGLGTARRMLLCADKFDLAALKETGWLDAVVADANELATTLDAWSANLAGMAPLALLGMKKHLNALAHGRLDAQQLVHDIDVASRSEDLLEGARAWKEKRAPVFKGA